MQANRPIAVLLLVSWIGTASAQTVVGERERLNFERPESWAGARATAATLFLGAGPPTPREPGEVRIGLELATIPDLSQAKTRVGFNGTKFEDLNKSPVFGRLRLTLGLPADFALELAWTPPVTIDGVKADGLYAAAVERPLFSGRHWRAGIRLYGQSGGVEGSITCSRDVFAIGTRDFERNPFGCARPSQDEVELGYYGIELSASRHFARQRLEPFAAVAVTRMKPEMQVNARLLGDVIDRSRRVTEGTTETGTLGLLFRPADRWEWLLAVSYTPLDVRRPPGFRRDSDDFWSVRLGARFGLAPRY